MAQQASRAPGAPGAPPPASASPRAAAPAADSGRRTGEPRPAAARARRHGPRPVPLRVGAGCRRAAAGRRRVPQPAAPAAPASRCCRRRRRSRPGRRPSSCGSSASRSRGEGRLLAVLRDERGIYYGAEGDVIEGRYRILRVVGRLGGRVVRRTARGRTSIPLSGRTAVGREGKRSVAWDASGQQREADRARGRRSGGAAGGCAPRWACAAGPRVPGRQQGRACARLGSRRDVLRRGRQVRSRPGGLQDGARAGAAGGVAGALREGPRLREAGPARPGAAGVPPRGGVPAQQPGGPREHSASRADDPGSDRGRAARSRRWKPCASRRASRWRSRPSTRRRASR